MLRPAQWMIAALLSTATLHAQSNWIYVRSRNFHVYSQASEQQTRTTLNYFDRVHDFFEQMTGRDPSNSIPVYVVIFSSLKEYEPYRVKEFGSAYYSGRPDRDYIVIGEPGEDAAQTAAHEYAHLAVHHTGARYPPWLDEGLAEVYSNLRPVGDEVEYASPIPARVRALAREPWVPLATILNAGENSPYYNQTNKAGSLYNESWALVHFLATSSRYGPGFEQVLRAIGAGTPSIQALESVYGSSLSRIEDELKQYLSAGPNLTLSRKMNLDSSRNAIASAPANMYDIRLALTSLASPASGVDTTASLENLARQDSTRLEPLVQLAYRAWSDRNTKLALEYFSKAYALGARNRELLWDYGRLAERDEPQDAARVLGDLLKLEPDNLDVRIELASAQVNAMQAREALATIGPIKTVDAERGQPLFYTIARAQLQIREYVGARASAVRLQSIASTKDYRDRAAEILTFLDEQERKPQAQRASAAPKAATAKPAAAKPVAMSEALGRIAVMDCSGVPSVVIETIRGRKTYLLEPDRYAVTGKIPGGQGLQCGPQDAPPAVRIYFEPLAGDSRGDGIVRELHFQ